MLSFVERQNLDIEQDVQASVTILNKVVLLLNEKIEQAPEPDTRLIKFRVWAQGLESSLKELYASYEAAYYYRRHITSTLVSDMTVEEKSYYAHYVYYDKNGFIRVFSLLDKLGTFINTLLDLKTERIKAHYSFFTVLRTLRERQLHPKLTLPLNNMKEKCKESTYRLRNRRNTEVHYMNSEMEDDLIQETRIFGQDVKLENLDQQLNDLNVGLQLNITAIMLTFRYAQQHIMR